MYDLACVRAGTPLRAASWEGSDSVSLPCAIQSGGSAALVGLLRSADVPPWPPLASCDNFSALSLDTMNATAGAARGGPPPWDAKLKTEENAAG